MGRWRFTLTANLGFEDDEGLDDETQFDVELDDLTTLFSDFCEENGFDESKLTYVDVVTLEVVREQEEF